MTRPKVVLKDSLFGGKTAKGNDPLTPERSALVVKNRPLVKWTIRRWFSEHLNRGNFEEIVAEGLAGLIRAAQLYTSSMGKFSHYARYWIRHSIQHYLGRRGHHREFPMTDCLANGSPRAEDGDDPNEPAADFAADPFDVIDEPPSTDALDFRQLATVARGLVDAEDWHILEGHYVRGLSFRDVGIELHKSHEYCRKRALVAAAKIRDSLSEKYKELS